MSPTHDSSRAVEKTRSFVRSRDVALGKHPTRVRSVEDVSLTPRCDRRSTSIEDDGSASDTNSDWDVVELNVVEHE
jgi:hypothetical protein